MNMEHYKKGDDMMDIETKTTLTGFLNYIRDFAYYEGFDEIESRCKELMEDGDGNYVQLSHLKRQYVFFNGLSRQTELDNIISLMKICHRLGVDMPQIQLDFENIEETYDLIWSGISEQVPLSDEMAMGIVGIAEKIMDMEDDLRENVGEITVDDVMSRCFDIIELEI